MWFDLHYHFIVINRSSLLLFPFILLFYTSNSLPLWLQTKATQIKLKLKKQTISIHPSLGFVLCLNNKAIHLFFFLLIKKAFDCTTACRDYRDKFSKAYKILYKNGELCYLTEILDSA